MFPAWGQMQVKSNSQNAHSLARLYLLSNFHSKLNFSVKPLDRSGFSVASVWFGRGPDGGAFLGTPTCNGTHPLPDKGEVASSPARCLGHLGSPAA